MITFRKTIASDIPDIMKIVNQAQAYFKSLGIDQWQNNYPNEKVFMTDIDNNHSYVFFIDNELVATAMISSDGESTYEYIDGKWITDNPYIVVHRMAVRADLKGKNIASLIMNMAKKLSEENGFKSIRVDTHRENKSMQRVLEKQDFRFCGIIYLLDGAERLAYEWCRGEE